jgi:hypothetical protein
VGLFKKGMPNMGKTIGDVVVMSMCLLGENEFQRLKDRGMVTGDYADYIEEFYCLQAEANTKGFKVIVVVFSEASFNEYLETFKSVFLLEYGHEPSTETEYSKARARWAHWLVTSDPSRFGF